MGQRRLPPSCVSINSTSEEVVGVEWVKRQEFIKEFPLIRLPKKLLGSLRFLHTKGLVKFPLIRLPKKLLG